MAGVQNNTARQYNLRGMAANGGTRVTVRLKPGFNVVDDKHWDCVKDTKFVKHLDKTGRIAFGPSIKESDQTDKHETATVKAEPTKATSAAPAPILPGTGEDTAEPPAHVMTEKANGATYKAFIEQGWDDEKLIAEGYMEAPVKVTEETPTSTTPWSK